MTLPEKSDRLNTLGWIPILVQPGFQGLYP
jgi:hypothetical protein